MCLLSPPPLPGVLQRRLQVVPPDNVGQFLGLYVSHLPLYEDTAEARVVHRQLCDLLDLDATSVLGKSAERAPAVIQAIADISKVGRSSVRRGRGAGRGPVELGRSGRRTGASELAAGF